MLYTGKFSTMWKTVEPNPVNKLICLSGLYESLDIIIITIIHQNHCHLIV